jgi:hypothetical protein
MVGYSVLLPDLTMFTLQDTGLVLSILTSLRPLRTLSENPSLQRRRQVLVAPRPPISSLYFVVHCQCLCDLKLPPPYPTERGHCVLLLSC